MGPKDFVRLIAAALVMLFCYTAVSKLYDVEEFRRQLANQELPGWVKGPLVWLIPGSELLFSLLLSFAVTRLAGLYGSAILMAMFTGYMALVYFGYFDRVPCSCGGVLRSMGFGVHLLFNLFFLALSLSGIYLFHQKPSAVTPKS